MATSTKRNNPSRTTNNNDGAAVRTPATRFNAKHYSSTIKTLRQIGKRGNSIADHSTKTYDEVECIAQTVDALACKIQDGQISANQIVLALEKIESRLHAVNGRINYAEMSICTLAGDAEWVADGNNNDD
jgi:hypothetical protein